MGWYGAIVSERTGACPWPVCTFVFHRSLIHVAAPWWVEGSDGRGARGRAVCVQASLGKRRDCEGGAGQVRTLLVRR